jgi:pyruvate/2-oxoglutarate dehydrogenase complex dihydrolipoamide acyltransferase (E2) component
VHFLQEIRGFSPVFLDTSVDMTAINGHRAAARADGHRYSVVSYVLHAAGRVLAKHPEANAALGGRLRPKVARYSEVSAKLTLDKRFGDQRVVLSSVLPDVHLAELADIQRQVEHLRDGDARTMPEFEGLRRLQKLPGPLAKVAFRAAVRPLRSRSARFGTFAVTSLGHRPVDGFHSVGGTTVTLGLGRVADQPVVRGGELAVAPVMRLNLCFDHRVIDGAEAADVLADLKDALEDYDRP